MSNPLLKKMVNLDGKTLMPSFIDAHSYFMSSVMMVDQLNVASPPMGESENIPTILAKLQAFKDERHIEDGQWIVGWGYDQDLLKEKRQITKTDIDAQFPNNKVLIIHASMHGAVLNSQAPAWAKIDSSTETPEGALSPECPATKNPPGCLWKWPICQCLAPCPSRMRESCFHGPIFYRYNLTSRI